MHKFFQRAAALLIWSTVGFPANAADLTVPIKAPTMAASAGGFYLWADPSIQSVSLPSYELGWRTGSSSTVPVSSYNVRANGWGIAGAIGYVLPGSNQRVELGGSYVGAEVAQSNNSIAFASSVQVTVSGATPIIQFACSAVTPCGQRSTLSTNYAAWQGNLKAASDVKLAANITATPSIAILGGTARNDQSFSQQFDTATGPYTATSSLNWTDVGVRIRVDNKVDLNPTVAFGLSGSIATTYRRASLSANDAGFLVPAAVPVGWIGSVPVPLSASATTIPVLANAEASVMTSFGPALTLRAFGGANYDSSVPGIAAPTYFSTGGVFITTPAAIKFASTTSWYAGGGLKYKF
jgi:hypothetical protein